MSTERAELPDEEEGRSWADRAASLAASVQSILSTRLAIFREEMGGKAALLGKGLAAIVIAAALGVGALLLFAALLAAVLAKLFGSAALGILGAMLIYAAGVAVAGRIAWKALTQVRPNEFPATERELARDWEAIKASLAPDPEPDSEDDAAAAGPEPDPHEVENLEARLRGGTD
jgi:hypothetical protein